MNVRIKSKDKFSYKLFADWLKTKKARKRLLVVGLLLFILSFSMIPIWLFEFPTGYTIEGHFVWEDKPLYSLAGFDFWVDVDLAGYEIELWDDGVLIGTATTDINGNVQFYAPDGSSVYQLKINGYTYSVVDFDTTVEGWMPPDAKAVTFYFADSGVLIANQDIDILFNNGTWNVLGTITTDGSGMAYIYLIDGLYSVYVANMTFTVDLTNGMSSDIPSVLYVEPYVSMVSMLIIILFIIYYLEKESRIKLINKSKRNLKKIRQYDNTEKQKRRNSSFKSPFF